MIGEALKWRELYYFDSVAADRVVRFFHRHVKHIKGPLAGKPFILEPWQRKIARRLFGWKNRSDGTRKFRTLFLFIAKKNGKSLFGAGLALYLLHADGEQGAEICSAAADKEQAKVLFDVAKTLNDQDPLLSSLTVSYKNALVAPRSGSSYKVISADSRTKDGPNWHGILFDELHAQRDRRLYDVLRAGVVARKQPLEIYMTTAGTDTDSIGYQVYRYAKDVAAGLIKDPTFFPVIYEADDQDDWTKEETWKKANPNYGISVFAEYFKRKVIECSGNPALLASFLRLHCNRWSNDHAKLISPRTWAKCRSNLTIPDLVGRECWGGQDLASTMDLASIALVFPLDRGWAAIMRYWCPDETMKKRTEQERERWYPWLQAGHIRKTPGGRIDYAAIRKEWNDLRKIYNIREIGTDPWNALQLAGQLENEDKFKVVAVPQTMSHMSDATKEFLACVNDHSFEHFGNPVLGWNAANLVIMEDTKENQMPNKKAAKDKIDGVVAVMIAMARSLRCGKKVQQSVYEGRGVLVL